MKKLIIFALITFCLSVTGCDDDDSNNSNNINNTNNTNNSNNSNNTNNTNNESCGNNVIEGIEVCDGSDTGENTCISLGYEGGTLGCLADCSGLDTTACTGEAGPFGFFYRNPSTQTVMCTDYEGNENEVEFVDQDFVCTIEYGDVSGYIYFQATAVDCELVFSEMPIYNTTGWISLDGEVSPLESPAYDFGGGHHNDFFTFGFEGVYYKYYHSSFGYGWRACQNMDCIQITDSEGVVSEDGCTHERTIPIVCSMINSDGTFDDLIDNFDYCPGDPNVE